MDGADVKKYGGFTKKNTETHHRIRQREREIEPPVDEYGEVLDYDPMEEEIEKSNKWGHKKKKGLIKGRGWTSKHKRGLPTRVKSGPVNKYRGKTPFGIKKRSLGAPWRN